MTTVGLRMSSLVLLLLLGTCLAQQQYTNPVEHSNRPDPGVIALPGNSGFVVVSTSNYANDNDGPAFPIMFSEDLVNWEEVRVN